MPHGCASLKERTSLFPATLRERGAGGEAASLREAPLPQTPSPEERLAFELVASSEVVPPERWVVSDRLD